MFRFLGMVAALDAHLRGGHATNLVPLNAVVLLMLLLGTMAGRADLESRPSSTEPRSVSLASLASGAVAAGSYVTVEGTVDPLYRLEIEKRSVWMVGRRPRSIRTKEQFLPLVDESGRIGILMTPLSPPVFSGRIRVTGIVERLPQVARDTLHREAATLPHRLNGSVMLASGEKPSSGVLGVVLLAICPALTVALAYVWLRRDLIFRVRTLEAAWAGAGHGVHEIDLRLTGRLGLGTGRPRRFLEVPARAVIDDRGQLVLGAEVDGSIYLSNLLLRKRIGFWSVTIPAGTVGPIVRGDVAFGTGIRPAAKVDIGGARPQTIALTFATVDQREHFLRALQYHCGHAARSAA